jgi:hypothetical protein
MFKRIFLAGTIAFPLYMMIAIQQSPPLSESIARSPDRAEKLTRKFERKLQDFQQEIHRVESSLSAE